MGGGTAHAFLLILLKTKEDSHVLALEGDESVITKSHYARTTYVTS